MGTICQAASASRVCNRMHDGPQRLITESEIRFSEIISALSVALDLTQGHSQGHCMRTALIGMRLAEQFRLDVADRSALFYALLLKDLGCSSNAAKISFLFGADDRAVKHSMRMIDWTKPTDSLSHCWSSCAPNGSTMEKLSRVWNLFRQGAECGRQISEMRCERGAQIARLLQLPPATSAAIYELDEHWNGHGTPRGLKGHQISTLARICCLAQTVEVFFTAKGLPAAIDVAQQRSGKWFDPALVEALLAFRNDQQFWALLNCRDLISELRSWEPEDAVLLTDDDCLDRVSQAFAMVVDAKSPWTYEHSTRVAAITSGIARQFTCSKELQRDLHRAALLHDLGKLGVSNTVLDKPGKLTPEEFAQVRKHPEYTQRILERVTAFQKLADIAGGHHERLDGRGYHRGHAGDEIPWATRVLTVADIYESLSAKRPYRDALEWETIKTIMDSEVGSGIDAECFEALKDWHDQCDLLSQVDGQILKLERLETETVSSSMV